MRGFFRGGFRLLFQECAMTSPARWNLEEYRALLRMQAQHLHLHPKLKRRFDWSDLAQEALLRAHRRLPKCTATTRAELVKWLLTILKNTYRDLLEGGAAAKRDPAREQYLDEAIDDSLRRMSGLIDPHQTTPSQQVEQEEMLLRMATALDELPEEERQVIILRYLVGETLAKIAEQTDRPRTTVSRLVMRGLDRLRRKLGPS
jgi:RNA polymerase sigma-70 factor, ECF subfamily